MELQKTNARLLPDLKGRVHGAMPVILYFLFNFLLVHALFGIQATIAPSVITAFYSTRRKSFPGRAWFARLLVSSTLLYALAWASCLNLAATIVLNFLVPFLLVVLCSDRFNPKGYFCHAMVFVFFGMNPAKTWEGFASTWLALLVSIAFLWAWMEAEAYWARRKTSASAEDPFDILASALEEMAGGAVSDQSLEKLKSCFFAQKAVSGRSRQAQALTVLLQRAIYLATDQEWMPQMDENGRTRLLIHASFLRKVGKATGLEKNRLIDAAQMRLRETGLHEGRLRVFIRSSLHLCVLYLSGAEITQEPVKAKPAPPAEALRSLAKRCSLKTYEARFALRMAIVMSLSNALGMVLPFEKAYWISLHAFLILQPSYEESVYRMRTRPVGTVAAALLHYVVYPWLPGVWGKLAYALVMLSLMRCVLPGTRANAFFSTSYALTITSMSFDPAAAIVQRILSLALAGAIVRVVNKCVLPTTKETAYRLNISKMREMHGEMWEQIIRSAKGRGGLARSSESLSFFYRLYAQCSSYISEMPDGEAKDNERRRLTALWHIFAELEQMGFYFDFVNFRADERLEFLMFAASARGALGKDAGKPLPKPPRLPERKDLAYVTESYLKNLAVLAY